jgi:hypothetical protein
LKHVWQESIPRADSAPVALSWPEVAIEKQVASGSEPIASLQDVSFSPHGVVFRIVAMGASIEARRSTAQLASDTAA